MNGAELKETLKSGGRVFGTMISIARNPKWIPILDSVGLDYVVIDTEHNYRSRGELGRLPDHAEHQRSSAHRQDTHS